MSDRPPLSFIPDEVANQEWFENVYAPKINALRTQLLAEGNKPEQVEELMLNIQEVVVGDITDFLLEIWITERMAGRGMTTLTEIDRVKLEIEATKELGDLMKGLEGVALLEKLKARFNRKVIKDLRTVIENSLHTLLHGSDADTNSKIA